MPKNSERFIDFFGNIGKEDTALAGGKGASLGEMTQAGIPVPPGFVVLSSSFEGFLKETDLNVEINAVLKTVNHKEMHTVENASEKIQALILAADIPKDIEALILTAFKKLGAKYVAVRSSATAEDSSSAAWAGQLDSFLNTTGKTLLQNVKRCWASLFTPRAIFYRFEKELHKQNISVAVVVQKMVESKMSGIAFSVHPVTEDRNQMIIEAGFGLGEAIVSGSITPDSYVVEKTPRRIIDKNVAEQKRALYRGKKGGTEWHDLLQSIGEKQVLSDEKIFELAELILRIENHYGFPCDIEWACEKGDFYITQSRPITTLTNASNSSQIDSYDKNIDWAHYLTRPFSLFGASLWQAWYGSDEIRELIGVSTPDALFIEEHQDVVRYYKEKKQMDAMRNAIENMVHEEPARLKSILKKGLELNDQAERTLKKGAGAYQNFNEALYAIIELALYATVVPNNSLPFIDAFKIKNRSVCKTAEKLRGISYYPRFNAEIIIPHVIRVLESNGIDSSLAPFVTLNELREKNFSALQERMSARQSGKRFIYGISGKKEYVIWTDDPMAIVREIEHVSAPESNVNELRGQTAYRGKATGVARLVLKDDIAGIKFEKGDILVSINSTPVLMPFILKSAAIVTDEGGVACHAAIVSRELKKPCVMGTKYATVLIKDGDLVEVDADKGIVRIVGKSEGRQTVSLKEKYHLDNSTWTYKGFHGVLHPFFPVGETGVAMRDFFGDAVLITLFFVQNDYVHWYWNDNDLTRIREEFLKRLKKDKRYLGKLKKERDLKIKAFNAILRHIDKIDLKKLSNEKIAELYDDFYRRYVDEFKYFMVLGDAVSMHADRYLTPEFKKILGKDFTADFPKLLSPHHLSFIEEEGVTREKLIQNFRKTGKLNRKELKRHASEFFYIHNNYAKGIRLTADDFAVMVREDAKKNVAPAKDQRKNSLAEKAKLIKKYKLSSWYQTLLYMMDEFFEFQDTRKKYVLISNYYQFQFLKEAERRNGIPFEKLRYSIYPEFRAAIAGNLDEKVLDERRKICACIHMSDGFDVVSGDLAQEALDFFQKQSSETREIKGMIASTGKARGRVKKILKIHDMANMEQGDILVSSMTRPEMVPAMKLAGAIVTDEGGVTSHAAIVSREMGIPCIIGTKIATQVLKDGDLVEVDADKGIVRILKKR